MILLYIGGLLRPKTCKVDLTKVKLTSWFDGPRYIRLEYTDQNGNNTYLQIPQDNIPSYAEALAYLHAHHPKERFER